MTTASCTFCGETLNTFVHPHVCSITALLPKDEVLSNRFDPYEALDTIIERVDEIEEQQHEAPDPLACVGRLADIAGEVKALRAYITGMENR